MTLFTTEEIGKYSKKKKRIRIHLLASHSWI